MASAEQRHDDAVKLFTDAYYTGQALDDPTVYLAALGQLLVVYTDARFDAAAARPWIRASVAAAQKDRTRAPAETATLLVALVAAADRLGDAAAALRYADDAATLVAPTDDAPLVLDAVLARAHAPAADPRPSPPTATASTSWTRCSAPTTRAA